MKLSMKATFVGLVAGIIFGTGVTGLHAACEVGCQESKN